GHAGWHDNLCAALFRSRFAPVSEPVGPRIDSADGGNSHIFHNYRTTHDAYSALQARLADRARAVNPFVGAIVHLARLDADLDRVVAPAHHWRRARHGIPRVACLHSKRGVALSNGNCHGCGQFFPLAVFGAGRRSAGRNRAWWTGRCRWNVDRNAGAHSLCARARVCLPFRVSCLRLGAFLRDGLPDCDGGASAQRPTGSLTGRQRTDRSRNADSCRVKLFREDASHTVLPPAPGSSTTWLTISNPILSSRTAYSAASRLAGLRRSPRNMP